jgi:hypothetical protein
MLWLTWPADKLHLKLDAERWSERSQTENGLVRHGSGPERQAAGESNDPLTTVQTEFRTLSTTEPLPLGGVARSVQWCDGYTVRTTTVEVQSAADLGQGVGVLRFLFPPLPATAPAPCCSWSGRRCGASVVQLHDLSTMVGSRAEYS